MRTSHARFCPLVVVFLLLSMLLPHRASAESELSLKVMTYNLRYASDHPPNAWPKRRPLVANLVRDLAPDLMGTQEGVFSQLKDLSVDLPSYAWIGLGRDGGSHGEFMAVFYKQDRFEPLEYDHFWLSDTPDVIASSTWGNQNRRMATWIRFQDRRSRREFYLMNTHLDHAVQEAREKGATLIRERVSGLRDDLPLILTGDFNAVAGANRAYEILVPNPFQDTWSVTTQRQGEELNTFNGFREAIRDGKRIDWILVRGNAKVSEISIVDRSVDGQFPSDHFPMIATISFPAP